MKGIQPLFDSLNYMLSNDYEYAHNLIYPADFSAGRSFLLAYKGSEATFNSYRRELEKLLLWCWHVRQISILQLTRLDIEQYLEFCRAPFDSWIGIKNVAKFKSQANTRIANPQWRPFVASLAKTERAMGSQPNFKQYVISDSAMKELLAVLSTFYNFLIQENLIGYNPISQLRQKNRYIKKTQTTSIVRRLSELQWSYVIESAQELAAKDKAHERTLFIMTCLYAMYLRISELVASARWTPKMRDFYQDSDGNWWFVTIGKGNKQRQISVSDAMLKALERYRASMGLTSLPTINDVMPLIAKHKGRGPIVSTRQIRSIVQHCFDCAVAKMVTQGLSDEANSLKAATVHWLRHTGISDDIKNRPKEHVRDDAGHSSSAITDKYIDIELRARHASAKTKKIDPLDS